MADGRGGRPHRRRSADRAVLGAPGHRPRVGARTAGRPGGVRPQPHRACPAPGLCRLRGAGPLHAVRGGAVAQRQSPAGPLRVRSVRSRRGRRVCAACDSARLKALRIGVTRATEELAALLGTAAVEVTSSPGAGRARRPVGGRDRGGAPPGRTTPTRWRSSTSISTCCPTVRRGGGGARAAGPGRPAGRDGRDGDGRRAGPDPPPDHEVLGAAVRADPAPHGSASERSAGPSGCRPSGPSPPLRGSGRERSTQRGSRRLQRCRASRPGPTIGGWSRAGDHQALCATHCRGRRARPSACEWRWIPSTSERVTPSPAPASDCRPPRTLDPCPPTRCASTATRCLKQVAREVDEVDGALVRPGRRHGGDHVRRPKASGLAAPQVGVQKRLFVYDVGEGPKAVVNPDDRRVERRVVPRRGVPLDPRPPSRHRPPEPGAPARLRPRRQRALPRGRRVPRAGLPARGRPSRRRADGRAARGRHCAGRRCASCATGRSGSTPRRWRPSWSSAGERAGGLTAPGGARPRGGPVASPPMARLVYLGTPQAAVAPLRTLVAAGHDDRTGRHPTGQATRAGRRARRRARSRLPRSNWAWP